MHSVALAFAVCSYRVAALPSDTLRGVSSLLANDVDHSGHHHHHKHHHHGGPDDEVNVCHKWDWRKKSLKLISEIPAIGLFGDLQGHDKFEISGVTRYKDEYVMVFDSLMELGFTNLKLDFMSDGSYLAGGAGSESEYEAITTRTRTDTLLAVKEGHLFNETNKWHPIVYEIQVNEDKSVKVLKDCPIDYELPNGDKKGIEGAEYIDNGPDHGEFILGLCEGNYCEGNKARGREVGNGRLVLAKLEETDAGCKWATQRLLHLPKSAAFKDYSDIDINGRGPNARVIVSSQEDAAVWVGHVNTETFEFEGEGTILHFPRMGPDCEMQYCNIEGVQFIDEYRIITTTDRSKKDQPWSCSAKDQSVQVFALPHNGDIPEAYTSLELARGG